ncbi:winged helix-turn-helix domain-containing protein [Porphyromonas pogonae]|uniref:winged helix-turn-helix domain-containing protein n=1 Tax=Porphyromonas pogonae TaxID=867595 RepID=UPI002E77AE51|nr:winged helix-turn-helix domain-containing protein [Porphyromonas pogonae]
MVQKIGENAGCVWRALNDFGKMDVKQLKKVTKIRLDKDLYAALGWLAKEGKLNFEDDGDDLKISVIY